MDWHEIFSILRNVNEENDSLNFDYTELIEDAPIIENSPTNISYTELIEDAPIIENSPTNISSIELNSTEEITENPPSIHYSRMFDLISNCKLCGINRHKPAAALRGNVFYIRFTPQDETMQPIDFFEAAYRLIEDSLQIVNNEDSAWKIHPVINVKFIKFGPDGDVIQCDQSQFSLPSMQSESFVLEDVIHQLLLQIEEFVSKGSGWVIEGIEWFDMRLTRYHSIRHVAGRGSNYDLPPKLASKTAVVNVQNGNAADCFKYALLSVLHYEDVVINRNRPTKYTQWLSEHNWEGITMPMTAGQLPKFEKQNPGITINLMEWRGEKDEKNPVHLIRAAPKSDKKPIHILCVMLKDNSYHYVGVTNLNRLLNTSRMHRKYCDWCLKPFFHKEAYEKHFPCQGDQISVRLLDKEFIQFESYAKTQELPYVMYGDCECYLTRINDSEVRHIPCAIGLLLVSHPNLKHKPLQIPYQQFVGEDCISQAMLFIEETAREVYEWNEEFTDVAMKMTNEDDRIFYETKQCYSCQAIFDGDKVKKIREHCHLTGKFRGAACSKCNNKMKMSRRKLPVLFHNLRNYDAHLLCTAGLKYQKHWDIHVIPQTKEKYLMMSAKFEIETEEEEERRKTMRIEFKDSAQFLQASLDTLSKNMDSSDLKQTNSAFLNMNIAAKGIFPYQWFDSLEKLKFTELPPISDFHDDLNQKACSLEDYESAQETWNKLKCETFEDYLLSYLRLDVHLLCDIFERFRRLTMVEDTVDPVHYPTIPSLTWDSAFKKTQAQPEVIHDLDMYDLMESGIRGGMTFVNEHHIKANIPSQPDYDLSKPRIEMLYVDENNLYGNALSMKLPYSQFKWVEDCEKLQSEFMALDLSGDTGYLIECDLIYPQSIHDKTLDLPFCPEKKKTSIHELSDFMRHQLQEMSIKYIPTEKLMLTQSDKEKYVIHGQLLQFYLKHGMVLKKIHRAIKFYQTAFFEPYISYNSKKRQEAKNSFEKEYYKLKNNALYGKTMENVKRRMNFRLVNDDKKLLNLSSTPHYLSTIIFDEDLVGVQLSKEQVVLDKPIYIGQCVLDLSKLIMYELFYEKLKPYESCYPNSHISIVGSDTDSFFLKLTNIDLHNEFLPRLFDDKLLDTSNYHKTHPLYSEKYKAQLGFVKDEAAGNSHLEWVLLKPKAYSMKLSANENIKRAKGVRRVTVKKTLNHDDYLSVYQNQAIQYNDQMRIASNMHLLSTKSYRKKSLSVFEDKRFWISKNTSVPYGHYSLKKRFCDGASPASKRQKT